MLKALKSIDWSENLSMKITKEIIQGIEGEATLELEWEEEKIHFARIKFFNFRGIEDILKGKPLMML